MKNVFLTVASFTLVLNMAAGEKSPGQNLAGKLSFSNQPFSSTGATPKKSFTSHEYIYGRLDLEGSTVKDAFKIKEGDNKLSYLQCTVILLKDGEEIASEDNANYFLVKDEEKGRSWLNFDILPEPAKATTVYSMLDDFSAGIGLNPLYRIIMNSQPAAGKYTIKIRLYSVTVDGWGKEQPKEKWPSIEDEFEFNFSDDDAAMILKNKDLTEDVIKENAFRYDKLPEVFSKGATITDPKATNAKIMAILKRDLPQRVILKMAIEKTSGTLWYVAKDDYGLPKYRYFSPDVYVAYKMDGKCYIGTVTLRENYEGGGTYGPLEVAFTSASNQPDRGIDCVKVK